MKKTVETKVELKENVLSGNALELNEADLEGAAGGRDLGWSSREDFERRLQDAQNQGSRFNTENPFKDSKDFDLARQEAEQKWAQMGESSRYDEIQKKIDEWDRQKAEQKERSGV